MLSHLWRVFLVLMNKNEAWDTPVPQIWGETHLPPSWDDRLIPTPMMPRLREYLQELEARQ